MDFTTGIAEIEADTYVVYIFNTLDQTHVPFRYDEPPPRNKAEAFWQWLVSGIGSFHLNSLLIAIYPDVIAIVYCFCYRSGG